MRIPRTLACILLAIAMTTAARADSKSFRAWFAGCDNTRSCSAVALNERGYGSYLVVARPGAPTAVPRITIVVDVAKGASFTLAFDDSALAGLPRGNIPGSPVGDDDKTRVEIREPAAVEVFIASLRKAAKINVTFIDPPGGTPSDPPSTEISLSGAAAALLWIDEQQRRLGTVTALIRHGDKSASAVPRPPAAPVVVAAKPGTAPIPGRHPPAVIAKGRKICDPDEPDARIDGINRLSGNLMLYWFGCPQMSGAYNHWSGLIVAPLNDPGAARVVALTYPPGEVARDDIPIRLVENAGFDAKTLTLTMFSKGRGLGDCGAAGAWAWDGRDFRLVSYQVMPACAGVVAKDWPAVYRAVRR